MKRLSQLMQISLIIGVVLAIVGCQEAMKNSLKYTKIGDMYKN